MAQTHFTCRVYNYDSPGNRLSNTAGKARSFNVMWAHFEELGDLDSKRGDGMNSEIHYFYGGPGAAANVRVFYVKETIYELGALAGKIASSAPAA